MNDSTISSLKEKLNTSTWHLVLLGAATYGVYPLMWLYKYQDTIMDETRQRFSSSAMIIWMAVCLGNIRHAENGFSGSDRRIR